MATPIPAPKKAPHPLARQDRVRLTILIHRKPDLSREEFSRYWREEHSQLFAGLAIVKKNLLKYEQSHVDTELVARLNGAGLPTVDCDGIAVFEAVNWDKIFEIFEDKEYQEVVMPDEVKLVDRERVVTFPSNIVGIFDDPT